MLCRPDFPALRKTSLPSTDVERGVEARNGPSSYGLSMHAIDLAEDLPVVAEDANALEAARILAEHRLPGIVVTDSAGAPKAVLLAAHVVRFLVPRYVQDDPSLAGVLDEPMADRAAHKLAEKSVREILPEHPVDVPSARPDDTIIEVAALMARSHSLLVAVTKGHRLLGIITASGLLAAALKR